MTAPFTQNSGLVPSSEPLPISVRGYVPCPPVDPASSAKKVSPGRGPSEWTLVFDTETAIDAGQNLRFGVYQLWQSATLKEAGIFFDPDELSAAEQELLKEYAESRGLKIMTRDAFVDDVFYGVAYNWRATIVGFNLPFDLSRLAIRHSSARGRTMRGGFTLQLSQNPWRPRVQVKHLSARNALIQFTKPRRRDDTRGGRKKQIHRAPRRGSFIDVKTLAAALFSQSFSLKSLADFLATSTRKRSTDEHGGPLTSAYVAYAVDDVQVTWECYQVLLEKLRGHALTKTRPSAILSEASIGKALLKEMGVRPFREVQPDFPNWLMGIIMSAYYGGRSEVRLRRVRTQVLYCDFLSMYPTVCTLMGLWRFVIANGMTWQDATDETRAFVDEVSLKDLQKPDAWKSLTTLVKIKPDKDIFPVRAKYSGQSQTIGLNILSSEAPLWRTLADVIASKLLTGKTPEIMEAIRFTPGAPQSGLAAIAIQGKEEYRVDPLTIDFFKRLIDLRVTVKARMDAAFGPGWEDLDDTALGPEGVALKADRLTLKIVANATSYGIFVEVIVNHLDAHEKRNCFGPEGVGFVVETDKSEEPGKFFHPLLATLITGAARLMLAISETLVLRSGLDWAFCDTDSMAIAKPADMDDALFYSRAKSVCAWFEPLNPYEKKGSLFKIEDANFALGTGSHEKKLAPLYALCISSKRYVLFNLSDDGEPIIRKASAHGLGHLLPPYGPENSPASIPAPQIPLSDIGVDRWQYDLWYQIIQAELQAHPDRVDLSYHPGLEGPAASRYGATTPDLLGWFKTFNRNRSYQDQVKPFNFLICFQSRPQLALSEAEACAIPKKGPRPKARQAKPVAPFDSDIGKASANAFDRETGAGISGTAIKTYREALAQYHLSPESKFHNGDFLDRGRTERRHIQASAIVHIGKEANKWEEQFYLGLNMESQIEYGAAPGENSLDERIRRLSAELGQREAARKLGISRMTLRKALENGCESLSAALRDRTSRKLRG